MISVVIPVYNVDKYITDCLESIVSQTFSEWEVVMVNDGSSDRSLEICKRFCERDGRFRVLEQENRGVSAARNTGIDACRGEYIFFMDADDTILPNTFEALNTVLYETKADMVSFQFQKIVDESEIHQVSQTGKMQVITAYEAVRLFLQEQQIGISMCTKLVKRSVVQNIKFEEGRASNEDKFFLFETLLSLNKVVLLQEPYYCYWTRENSATTRPFDKRWFDGYFFAKKIYRMVCERKPELEPEARYQLLSSCYFLVRQMDNKKASKLYPEEYQELCKEISKLRVVDIWKIISPKRRKGIFAIKYAPFLYRLIVK